MKVRCSEAAYIPSSYNHDAPRFRYERMGCVAKVVFHLNTNEIQMIGSICFQQLDIVQSFLVGLFESEKHCILKTENTVCVLLIKQSVQLLNMER